MTGIEQIVGIFLGACMTAGPVEFKEEKYRAELTVYECPLIGDKAEFVVWRRVCPNPAERPAVAIRDRRTGRGWVLNQFLGVETAFVEVEGMQVFMPKCQLEKPTEENQ